MTVLLLLLILNLVLGFLSVHRVMEPAIPIDPKSESEWDQLVVRQRDHSLDASWHTTTALFCFATPWLAGYFLLYLGSGSVLILGVRVGISLGLFGLLFMTLAPHLSWPPRWWSRRR